MALCVNGRRHPGSGTPPAILHLHVGVDADAATYEGASWCSIECMAEHLTRAPEVVKDIHERAMRRATEEVG